MTDASRAYVGLLGPLLVARQDSVELVRGPKQRIVLSALALNPGRSFTIHELVDRVWHDQPPPTAASALRVHIQHLREMLSTEAGNPIPYLKSGYALAPQLVETDLSHLEQLTTLNGAPADAANRLKHIEAALALWRGEPFADLRDDPEFNVAAMRLDEIHRTLAEDRCDLLLQTGRHAEAVSELTRLVEQEPFRERRTRLLMLALYRSGRQREALAAYQALRRRLRVELGPTPAPSRAASRSTSCSTPPT